MPEHKIINQLDELINIGIAISAEKNPVKLLQDIVEGAIKITGADGGTLYLVKDNEMSMEIVQSKSLGVSLGGISGNSVDMPPIPLFIADGSKNNSNVVSCSYHKNAPINIINAYTDETFDFSGTKKFDQLNNYRSQSFLAVPMKNHEGDTIGVLQLINAIDKPSGVIIAFDEISQRFTETLASFAATVLTKQYLIDDLEGMFESLIQLIATAIDDKSPYTGGHCRRVPALTLLLAEAAHNSKNSYLKFFTMTDKDRYELKIAGWLHDCGKITTPEYVVDKSTKLETIFDRIELIETRFEVLKRDAEIAMLKQISTSPDNKEMIEKTYQDRISQLDNDFNFIKKANTGGEFMDKSDQDRILAMCGQRWTLSNLNVPVLSKNEADNLTIVKGTLTSEERGIINHHINATISMLDKINFPKHLKNVPEYAGGHHERMDGKGYPKGLKREQMSVQARVMAIADIFEALTAKDRPYKEGKKLSEAIAILTKMKEGDHVDPDLFDVFIKEKVYLKYANEFLDKNQIDMA
ncbi:MAG: GAF domain-containing protein [Methylococcales bacterium]|nr:GAF domain-containing protein [Methylococcales bacterium]